jgi:hypothetical protein
MLKFLEIDFDKTWAVMDENDKIGEVKKRGGAIYFESEPGKILHGWQIVEINKFMNDL